VQPWYFEEIMQRHKNYPYGRIQFSTASCVSPTHHPILTFWQFSIAIAPNFSLGSVGFGAFCQHHQLTPDLSDI
jgi:hypothetical protein